jgi:invasion protein IalB
MSINFGEGARRRVFGVALWALALIAISNPETRAQQPAPATAPPPKPEAQTQPPTWRVACDNSGKDFDCRVSQTIFLQKTGQRLLSVVVHRASKAEDPALMLHLPHGLFLPAGTTIQIDQGKLENLVIQTCDDKGCYAGAPVTKDILSALQKAEKLNVTFQDLQKQTITVPMPLAGFAEAYQKLP